MRRTHLTSTPPPARLRGIEDPISDRLLLTFAIRPIATTPSRTRDTSMTRLLTTLLLISLFSGCATTVTRISAPTTGLAAQLLHERKLPKLLANDMPPPPETAPLETLARYWANNSPSRNYNTVSGLLTPALRRRLLLAAQAYPEHLPYLVMLLARDEATQDAVFALCQLPGTPGKPLVASWLMQSGKYLRAELVQAAQNDKEIVDFDHMMYGANIAAALPLAKLDWDTAEPCLQRLVAQAGRFSAQAANLLLEHARQSGNAIAAARYLQQLRALARGSITHGWARNDALEYLQKSDFPGRTDFFHSLFLDPRFKQNGEYGDRYGINDSNCLAFWAASDLAANLPFIINLLSGDNPIARQNGVGTLLLLNTPESLAPLLPALTHPADWPEGTAQKLVWRLRETNVPGAAPPLESYFDNGDKSARINGAFALACQGAPHAAAAIRATLLSMENSYGDLAVAALRCPSISDDQLLDIFWIAAAMQTGDPRAEPACDQRTWNRHPVPQGRDALLLRLLTLARDFTRDGQGRAGDMLLSFLLPWGAPAIDHELVARLGTESPTRSFYAILFLREELLRAHEAPALARVARRGTGVSAGLAAALSRDPELQGFILQHGDAPSQQILLACAAQQGFTLPLPLAAQLLNAPDAALSDAAQAYLLYDNSPSADAALRARFHGQYLLMGGGMITPSADSPAPTGDKALSLDSEDATLWRLQREMQGPDPPDEIYALFTWAAFTDEGNIFIRVRHGHASLQWQKRYGIYRQRDLSPEELASLKQGLAENPADYLPNLDNPGVEDGDGYCYAHFTSIGGRTCSMNNPEFGGSAGSIYDLLPKRIRTLVDHGNFEYHNYLEGLYPGTGILLHDPDRWLSFIVNDNGTLKIRVLHDKQEQWIALRDGRLAEPVSASETFIVRDFPNPERASGRNFIRSTDNKWALLEYAGEIRINVPMPALQYADMATGKIADVPLPTGFDFLHPGGYIASKNCFLVHARDQQGKQHGWLFDPVAATLAPFPGDLDPLVHWGGTPLQPAGPNTFWLASTNDDTHIARIGRYNFDNFTFQVVFTLPDIYVDDDRFWVDQPANRLLLIANGDLVQIPLLK